MGLFRTQTMHSGKTVASYAQERATFAFQKKDHVVPAALGGWIRSCASSMMVLSSRHQKLPEQPMRLTLRALLDPRGSGGYVPRLVSSSLQPSAQPAPAPTPALLPALFAPAAHPPLTLPSYGQPPPSFGPYAAPQQSCPPGYHFGMYTGGQPSPGATDHFLLRATPEPSAIHATASRDFVLLRTSSRLRSIPANPVYSTTTDAPAQMGPPPASSFCSDNGFCRDTHWYRGGSESNAFQRATNAQREHPWRHCQRQSWQNLLYAGCQDKSTRCGII